MSDTPAEAPPPPDPKALRRVGAKLVAAFRDPKVGLKTVAQAALLAAVVVAEEGLEKAEAMSPAEATQYAAKTRLSTPIAWAALQSENPHRVVHAFAAHAPEDEQHDAEELEQLAAALRP